MSLSRLGCGVVAFGMLVGTGYAQAGGDAGAAYKDARRPVAERVADLLGRMTLEEKISLLSGSSWMESAGVPRLGIPAIKMADGPMGIRIWTGPSSQTSVETPVNRFSSTAFPAGINVAASWDPELARQEGQVIGQEVAAVGRDMILGPTVNIHRTPLWGRNFESYGEDPYLSGRMAVGYIKGVQSEGILPSVKHFTVNNEEFERHRIDVAVDERALHEIYFPAFEAAIKDAHVWTVMSSYNKVNGAYAAESPLLKQELYKEFGFKGFVVSDWGSTYSTAGTVNAGMDIEMPGGPPMRKWLAASGPHIAGNDGGYLVPEKVMPLVKSNEIPVANVNENAGRILTVIFESGLYDHQHVAGGAIDTPAQRALTRKAADEGIVLLKNQGGVLPLEAGKVKSIAVIGPGAATARAGGGGSGLVYAKNIVSPLDGIRARATGVDVRYALGAAMAGEEPEHDTAEAKKKRLNEAIAAAKDADAAVVFVGYSWKLETEGKDRPDMKLPEGQDEMIRAVAAVNKRTIVVLNAGDSVDLTQWVDQVPGLVDAWYGGEEGGNAVADILFGDANPSGKLPFTFLRRLEDSPSYGNYPGENLHVKYAEGIYVGYRYFDKHIDVPPLFPFGFGLSYTTFQYSDLKVHKGTGDEMATVSLTVKNTGARKGAEVAQLYVGQPHASVDRPVKELKGFQRVELAPGESRSVQFVLDRRAFSFYSVAKHGWVAEPGSFDLAVGSSSRDIRLESHFVLGH
ncbi:glycoside hydrolase family 3 C-terminal domain-containing protein [Granulicella tundricola]|uniref:Glycoside hydrolase family 3 domain protein n=1 Tax=Granulicella tundricola (strain ATCC BAA-1859 / DSM 23138 / MP5ACTX9) TaxID=1198114 RepID=E8WZI6_GRATM|nr:glycoside hydrolase family 3 C-terminal domain-containing protein [Granulicella tundricola]ADW68874.1 glycoside hydrolase family 3 domain protein [Granulicella tundricola MP5ACTX9]